MCYIAILNIRSIQQYVFNSNKLKHIIAASYVVKHIFDDLKGDRDGYIGGGNALIIFNSEKEAEEEIKKFTKETLTKYPGIQFAIGHGTYVITSFKSSKDNAFNLLTNSKSIHAPVTDIPGHGINEDCPLTGLPAENKDKQSARIIKLEEKYKELQENKTLELSPPDSYIFASSFEDMGQIPGTDSHIAVIHIDINGWGKEFKEATDLETAKALSAATPKLISEPLKTVITEFIDLVKNNTIPTSIKLKKEKNRTTILPLRPIINAGDEITVVCNSKMALWFAKRYMEEISKFELSAEISDQSLKKQYENKKITSSAGICVVRTKYPFYRAYKLAEALCKNAKKTGKKDEKNIVNTLDFHYAASDIKWDDLDTLRSEEYTNIDGFSLIQRPMTLTELDEKITACPKNTIATGWIKDIRDTHYKDETSKELLELKANWRNVSIKEIGIDTIELAELIEPAFFSKKDENKTV